MGDDLEALLLHAFIDLIQERKAAGRRELVATHETIARWLSDRTGLAVTPRHVQYLTLALRDGQIIDVGGGGIGRPTPTTPGKPRWEPRPSGTRWMRS